MPGTVIGPARIRAAKILIVDDQDVDISLLESVLRRDGYSMISSTQDPEQVAELHSQNHYDLILLDLLMPQMDGFQVMEALREIETNGYLPVLVITALPEHKMRAFAAGARDFVCKPLDFADVLMRVYNMLEVRLLHLEVRRLYDQVIDDRKAQDLLECALQEALSRVVHEADEPQGIVAKSGSMRKLIDLASRVAKVDSTVLITGQSGAGKERIARLLHEESSRCRGPFIAVNCGAITENLLESELFGHAKGAFSGATQERPGLFEAADGGTLLLDEIGEIPASMQVKLLRALQEREIRRVGENLSRKVDVRIVAATNRDLSQEVANGNFRQDLYYRMNVVPLQVPPLRERREDILPLARVLLAEASLRMKRKVSGLSPEAADKLVRYTWPGNVRELENAMERAVALSPGTRVELEDLPEEVRNASLPAFLNQDSVRSLEEIEREYILASLERNGGNQTQTAQQLRIGSATLYRKLKSYGLIAGRNTPDADRVEGDRSSDSISDFASRDR